MQTVEIIRPDDFHAHFRQGEMLRHVLPWTAKTFARAIAMPNLDPPVRTGEDALRYRQEILQACRDTGGSGFNPLMTIYLTDETTPDTILAAQEAGVVAAKLYMRGTTTNSHHGVADLWRLRHVFVAMQHLRLVLCVHGEWAEGDVMRWELNFLPRLRQLASEFPNLRIVLEHITTRAAVDCVLALPDNVGATITAHHLVIIHNDVVGWGRIQPHNFCMPLAKDADDREALIAAAISANPKFFFGSDTAPHLREKKECASGCAGLFTAPVALPVLAAIFEQHNALDRLSAFTSVYGATFYGLPLNTETITLMREPWEVPRQIAGIVPFQAGNTLAWRIT